MLKPATSTRSNNLPSGTTVENLLNLINVLIKNNKSEESVKALFGMADSVYICTKSALKAFGIIENDSLIFSAVGREIAYSAEDDKKAEIKKIVGCYEPYELVLNSITTSKSTPKTTDIDTIKNLWGKAGFGSGDRNRNDGATLFMSIIHFIGLGKYIIGRNSNPTRIEWAPDIVDKINSICQKDAEAEQIDNTSARDTATPETNISELAPVETEADENLTVDTSDLRRDNCYQQRPVGALRLPNITINVDMSSWSDEKIKTFFKYAYGKFEEN